MEIEATGLNHEVWQSPSTIENRLSSDGEKSKIHPPAAAVWIGALVLAIYLSLLPFVERTWRATGDEPHYLLAAHSLATDLDFDLANNYEQLDFLNFYSSKDITPQIRLSPGGQQILDHQLGLPVIIAPAYAFAGRFGALVFQAVLGSLLAALTFKLALLVSKDETASLLATLFVTLSPPLLMYNYLVYPELPGALLTTLVLYYAVSQSRATPAAFVLTLFSLVTLPWLNRRFMPMTILLALLLVWAWRKEEAWMVGGLEGWKLGRLTAKPRLLASSALLILAAAVFSVALLLWFDSRFTKVGELDITVPATAFILWERVTRGLVGWLVDQQRGLFI
ncbi:MAG TPA: hypothetical protein VEC93_18075, partial [Anaerolineae bacterium]|nr:hypothetical protein [Anaerolineae bacterium]